LMKDMPPGRQRVVTSRVPIGSARDKVWDFIRQKLRTGRQAYVICPRIGPESDAEAASDGQGAEQVFSRLSQGELRGFRLGLVHGQLAADSKGAVMDAFRRGQTQVLVATTVVEVGVDVPNATLMVVHSAEKFGLSQLHQL